MRYGTVYLITNTQNGKRYVGQTVQDVGQRFLCHRHAKSAIGNALRKYGPSAFVVEAVFSAGDPDALNAAEVALIEEYGSRYPGGYNLRSGGAPGLHSEHTKRKIAAAHLGKPKPPLTSAHKAKISAHHKGKTIPRDIVTARAQKRRGQKWSDEARLRFSERCKARGCKLAGWNKGVSPSADTRARMSLSHRKSQ